MCYFFFAYLPIINGNSFNIDNCKSFCVRFKCNTRVPVMRLNLSISPTFPSQQRPDYRMPVKDYVDLSSLTWSEKGPVTPCPIFTKITHNFLLLLFFLLWPHAASYRSDLVLWQTSGLGEETQTSSTRTGHQVFSLINVGVKMLEGLFPNEPALWWSFIWQKKKKR